MDTLMLGGIIAWEGKRASRFPGERSRLAGIGKRSFKRGG